MTNGQFHSMGRPGTLMGSAGKALSALTNVAGVPEDGDARIFSFTSGEAGFDSPDELLVWRWECDEALSETYLLRIDLATTDVDLDYLKLLGSRATFQIVGEGANRWHGCITSVELTGIEAASVDNPGASYLYLRVTLEPQLALLRQDVTSRVYPMPLQGTRQLSTLIRHAMGVCNLKPERAGTGDIDDNAHPYYGIFIDDGVDHWSGKDFFFQYQESTLNFLSRHLEHRGVYYWFEQYKDNEEVVFCSENSRPHSAHEPASVLWQASETVLPEAAGRYIAQLTHRHTISPSAIVVDEFNPDHTDLDLRQKAVVPPPPQGATYRSWGKHLLAGGGHLTQAEGKALAERQMEEQLCQRNQFQVGGLVRHLHAGSWFQLQGHPREELNDEYIVTRIRYEGEQALPHKTESGNDAPRLWSVFNIISSSVQFRPPRRTARPHIAGLLHAIVESGDETADYSEQDMAARIEGDPAVQKATSNLSKAEAALLNAQTKRQKAHEARKDALSKRYYEESRRSEIENRFPPGKQRELAELRKKLSAAEDSAKWALVESVRAERRAEVARLREQIGPLAALEAAAQANRQAIDDATKAINRADADTAASETEITNAQNEIEAQKKKRADAMQAARQRIEQEKRERAAGQAMKTPDEIKKETENAQKKVPAKWAKPYLNEKGYYRIRFLFAEHSLFEKPADHPGRNSAWVRMATPYSGHMNPEDGDFGMYFPLKENTEVLVAFIDGNPDEPIIVATVPNAAHKSLVSGADSRKNVTGMVMPGGNTLAFTNEETHNIAVLASPVANSYIMLGGDTRKPDHQGILLSSRSHITIDAKSKKEVVLGKSFSRLYDLDVGAPAAKKQDPSKTFWEAKDKFKAGWLHPDSGYDFSIQKPKITIGASLVPTVDFSAKIAFSMGVNISAAYSLEVSHKASYNFLEKKATEKELKTKVALRETTVLLDEAEIGTRNETVLAHKGSYGSFTSSTKQQHIIEAAEGIMLSSVSSVELKRSSMDEAAATKPPKSLAEALLSTVNLKESWNKLRGKTKPLDKKVKAIDLSGHVKKDMLPRNSDTSTLILSDQGVLLKTKADAIYLNSKHGSLLINQKTTHLSGKQELVVTSKKINITANGENSIGATAKLVLNGKTGMDLKSSAAVTVDSAVFQSKAKLTKMG